MLQDIDNFKQQLGKYGELLTDEQIAQLKELFLRLSRKLIFQYVASLQTKQ